MDNNILKSFGVLLAMLKSRGVDVSGVHASDFVASFTAKDDLKILTINDRNKNYVQFEPSY